MRLPLLQINPTAGDLDGNSALIVHGARTARAQGADLMVTSELALMDYRPRDLLMNQGSVYRAGEKLSHIAGELKDAPPLLVFCRETAVRPEWLICGKILQSLCQKEAV